MILQILMAAAIVAVPSSTSDVAPAVPAHQYAAPAQVQSLGSSYVLPEWWRFDSERD